MTERPTRSTAARDALGDFAPKLVDLTDRVLFDDVWARPELGPRDRSLATCSALIATGKLDQLRFHIPKALENGVTRDEMVELITHLAFYVGWPSAMGAVQLARELFEALPDGGAGDRGPGAAPWGSANGGPRSAARAASGIVPSPTGPPCRPSPRSSAPSGA